MQASIIFRQTFAMNLMTKYLRLVDQSERLEQLEQVETRRVTTKPGLWTGLHYGLDSIIDSQQRRQSLQKYASLILPRPYLNIVTTYLHEIKYRDLIEAWVHLHLLIL